MTTLSFPLKICFHPTPTTTFLLQPQTVTFSPIKSTVTTACSASQNPHQRQKQQHQQKQKKNQSNANASSDGEKGFDPAGFLAKRGISHKVFAQFLRERQAKPNTSNKKNVAWRLDFLGLFGFCASVRKLESFIEGLITLPSSSSYTDNTMFGTQQGSYV